MTPAAPFRTSFAVVIGIDQYREGIPELRTAVNDARRLGEMLGTLHGYTVIPLLDGDATGARITTLLTQDLPAQVGPDDRVLFYFAGHGVARDGDDGPNGYLLPVDAARGVEESYLSMPRVHDALLALPCRHMLVVLDSCFSGAFRWSGTRDIEDDVDVVHQERYDRFVRDPAWQVITSASQDQKAIDQLTAGGLGGRGDAGAHSPFALALFDAISGAGDVIPRGEGDGLVTATELYLYLEEALQQTVGAAGKQQTPRLWPLKKHDKGEFLFFVPGRALSLPPAPELTFERNPWIGLASYDASNAALFFGRDAEIAALCEKISVQPLTVVLGASGTGKSSLVKAGAVPRLTAAGWHVLPVMRPGATPLAALAQAVSDPDRAPVAADAAAITQRIAALIAAHPGAKHLLVIDQFEELLTLVASPAERTATLALLSQLVTAHPDAFRLVVTIRTDFEPNFDRSAFGPLWTAGRYVIPPMSRESMRAVIEQPATARVLYFEPSALVETLLDEVVATPGALPLLSFALSEMYISFVTRQGGDRAITTTDYEAVGGVAGALRSRAEAEYDALAPDERETLRRVMLRMVASDGSGLARRRIAATELDFADAAERTRARNVVTRLTSARLLVEGKEADGEAFVEPAHDALVRGWGRLQEWIRAEQGAPFSLQQQRLLTRSTTEWDRAASQEQEGLLWRDSARSAQLVPLVRSKAVWLTQRELAFAQRSIRRRNVARAITAAAVLAIAVAGVIATVAGVRASRRAEEVRIASIVRSAQAAVTDDPLLAAQLLGSIDSSMVEHLDDGTRLSLIGTTIQLNGAPQVDWTFGDGARITRAVISADGTWLVDAEDDGFVYVRDIPRRVSHILSFAFQKSFGDATFDDGKTLLALGTTDGEVLLQCLLDLSQAPRKLFSPGSDSIAFTRLIGDGTRLLTLDAAHVARVVAVPHPCEPGDDTSATPIIEVPDTYHAAFTAGGGIVVTDSKGRFTLISADGRQRRSVNVSKGAPYTTLAVSHDGRYLALGAADKRLRVTAVGPNPSVAVLMQEDSVLSLAFSADGSTLVSAHENSGVHRWDMQTGDRQLLKGTDEDPHDRLVVTPDGRHVIGISLFNPYATVFDESGQGLHLGGHKEDLVAVSVTPDGGRTLTVSRDGSIWVWKAPEPPLYRETRQLPGAPKKGTSVSAIAFSPDARQVMLGTRNGSLFRYRLDSLGGTTAFAQDTGVIRALQWGPDGASVHTLTEAGRRAHWRFTPTTISRRVAVQPTRDQLLDARPAGDGRHVLSLTADAQATVWDLTSDAAPVRLTLADSITLCRLPQDPDYTEGGECFPPLPHCVALSGTATRLATCEGDNDVLVRDLGGSTPPRKFTSALGIRAIALSPDGRQLAGAVDSVLLLWDVEQPTVEAREVTVGPKRIEQLVFSPDGQLVAIHSEDGRIRVVNVRTTRTVLTVQPRSGKVDALRFTPDGRHLLAYGFGPREVRLWNVIGSSASLPIRTQALAVQTLEISPDSRWMVVADNDDMAQLVPLDAHLALAPFRRVRECLAATLRERYLLETSTVASERAARCQPPARRTPVFKPVSR